MIELRPHLHEGVFVFVDLPPGATVDAEPVASVVEAEGRTVVLPEAEARRLALPGHFPSARITLGAATALTDVGVLARVTGALAAAGISVNPFAGVHHDHLFVPHDRGADAVRALAALAEPLRGAAPVGSADEYEVDEDPARVDRDVVWGYLSTDAYWARWRSRGHVDAQIDAAWRTVGAYRRGTGEMVGFARAVGDGVSFAYLADVFVLDTVRGAGLGKALVAAMLDDERWPHMRWTLFTSDAHGLYAQYGFTPAEGDAMVRVPAVPV